MRVVRRFIITLVAIVGLVVPGPCPAGEGLAGEASVTPRPSTGLPKGSKELSLSTGYTYTYRRTGAHVTKLQGVPAILGGGLVITDPIGNSWYRGQFTVGAEAQFTQYVERLSAYLVALTPTVKYTFRPSGTWRPYVEAGAGLVWTDLGDRIPEKGSQFNFNLQAGAGLSYVVAPTMSVNMSYRFQHISNAGTAHPNHGVDAGVLLLGISKVF